MADFLESYAARFELPVRTGARVDRLARRGEHYVVTVGGRELVAGQVVVAMATYQRPRRPAFARELSAEIVQLHSREYKNPAELRAGDVLIVGAGNSGAEIAMELARRTRTGAEAPRRVFLSGRDTGHLPFHIDGPFGKRIFVPLVLRFLFHHVFTVDNPLGRKVRPRMMHGGAPLIRTKPRELAAAGVERVGRIEGVREGKPRLANGQVLDVANVIWCTGFDPGFSWIALPIFDDEGEPRHDAGVVRDEPGLYFVGLHFLYSMSSTMIHGAGRDAARIARAVAARAQARRAEPVAPEVATAYGRLAS
jgi:putative flavoprotein involved in K+ transport